MNQQLSATWTCAAVKGCLKERAHACYLLLTNTFFRAPSSADCAVPAHVRHTRGHRTAPAAMASIAAHSRSAATEGTRVAKRPKAPHTSKRYAWRVTTSPSLHDSPTFADAHKNRTRVKKITHVSDLRFEKVLFYRKEVRTNDISIGTEQKNLKSNQKDHTAPIFLKITRYG